MPGALRLPCAQFFLGFSGDRMESRSAGFSLGSAERARTGPGFHQHDRQAVERFGKLPALFVFQTPAQVDLNDQLAGRVLGKTNPGAHDRVRSWPSPNTPIVYRILVALQTSHNGSGSGNWWQVGLPPEPQPRPVIDHTEAPALLMVSGNPPIDYGISRHC